MWDSSDWPTAGEVHRVLHPLQEEADRVGKQVEEFAEALDRFCNRRRTTTEDNQSAVLKLVQEYRKIASSTVKNLHSIHARERHVRRERLSGSMSARPDALTGSVPQPSKDRATVTTISDLERWEQEEQTWHLLGLMLQVEYPLSADQSEKGAFDKSIVRPRKDSKIHLYSSEQQVWDHFLAHDDQAWERHTVVEWLKKCAHDTRPNVELVVKELEQSADRGTGLWAHSWLYTKEAIKGQKRLRSWSQALAPDSPGLDASLRSSDRARSLVTQLDPDAAIRQNRSLESQDEHFEKAIWVACWEMIRCGQSWATIRAWCQERVENWRAIAMRGDPSCEGTKKGTDASNSLFSVGWQSRTLWRASCASTAQSIKSDHHEAAVYGSLGGYLPAMLRVCNTLDDFLFAHFTSYLLRSFDDYILSKFSDRLPQTVVGGETPVDTIGALSLPSSSQIVETLREVDMLKEESRQPLKLLQGSLISKSFENFAYIHGIQLAISCRRTDGTRNTLPEADRGIPEGAMTTPIGMTDYDLIRIITHIVLIFQHLGLDLVGSARGPYLENFVVAYIDFLSKAGKQQLLSLYASRLSYPRAVSALGRQLPLILERGERRDTMNLMKQNGIDVPGVLNKQLQIIVTENPPPGFGAEAGKDYPHLAILEKGTDQNHPKVRPIKIGFMGDVISDSQHDLIRGFEWFTQLDGHWEQTMATGAALYKYLLSRDFILLADRARADSGRISGLERSCCGEGITPCGQVLDHITGEGSLYC